MTWPALCDCSAPRSTSFAAFFRRKHRRICRLLNLGDHALDFFRGSECAVSQALDFSGNDCEAPPVFASACGLDRRVERKQVGFVGKIVDQIDDLADLLRAFAKAEHALRDIAHALADSLHRLNACIDCTLAVAQVFQRLLCGLGNLLGRNRDLACSCPQFLDCGTDLRDGAGLLGCAASLLVRCRQQLRRSGPTARCRLRFVEYSFLAVYRLSQTVLRIAR